MAINLSKNNSVKTNLEIIRSALNETYYTLWNGATGLDLGAYCLSTKINVKSKYKPVNIYTPLEITDSQRKGVNWGHTLNVYDGPTGAMEAVMQGVNFPYVRPQNYYRLFDFNNYDHNATDWFSCSPMQSSVEPSGTLDFRFDNILDIFQLGDLSSYDPSLPNINFGFILRESAFSEHMGPLYYYPCTGTLTISDIADNKIRIILNNQFGSSGNTWYGYPVLTTEGGQTYQQGTLYYIRESAGGLWYPYPFCNSFSFKIGGGSGPGDISTISAYFNDDYSIESLGNYIYNVNTINVLVSNSNNISVEVRFVTKMTDAVKTTSWTVFKTIPANTTITVDLTGGESKRYESALDAPAFSCIYNIKGHTETKNVSGHLYEK